MAKSYTLSAASVRKIREAIAPNMAATSGRAESGVFVDAQESTAPFTVQLSTSLRKLLIYLPDYCMTFEDDVVNVASAAGLTAAAGFPEGWYEVPSACQYRIVLRILSADNVVFSQTFGTESMGVKANVTVAEMELASDYSNAKIHQLVTSAVNIGGGGSVTFRGNSTASEDISGSRFELVSGEDSNIKFTTKKVTIRGQEVMQIALDVYYR